MTPNEYQIAAMRTSSKTILPSEHLMNGALGLAGEAGEVADIVKKATFQGHTINREHLRKSSVMYAGILLKRPMPLVMISKRSCR